MSFSCLGIVKTSFPSALGLSKTVENNNQKSTAMNSQKQSLMLLRDVALPRHIENKLSFCARL